MIFENLADSVQINKKRSVERLVVSHSASGSTELKTDAHLSTFGKNHAHKKLDKLSAVEGESDTIIPEDFNENEAPVDLDIDFLDVSPYMARKVMPLS